MKTTKLHRKKMNMLANWMKRGIVALIGLFVVQGVALAAPRLLVQGGDNAAVCPGFGFEMQASGFSSSAVTLYRSDDNGGTWKAVVASQDPSGVHVFADQMGSSTVKYQVRGQQTSEVSNTVTIGVSTNDCPAPCHTTSTGDIYLGTDFNPEDGHTENDINWNTTPPQYLQSYFDENGISFKGECSNGGVVKNWKYSNGTKPYLDRTEDAQYSNYYYAFTPSGCSQPFKLQFKGSQYQNKYYRFTIRMYVDLSGCTSSDRGQMPNTYLNFRTDYGNTSDNAIDMVVYNDATGDQIATRSEGPQTGQIPSFQVGDIFANNGNVDYFRVDITFYGQFKDNNPHQFYEIIPEFQQWSRSCMKVAVDFISAVAESVCVNDYTVCVGESTLVNAAGFFKDANYKWEVMNKTTGNWEILTIDGFQMQGPGYQTLNIPITQSGVNNFRVSDTNHNTSPIGFSIVGDPNCGVLTPSKINGPDPLCLPFTEKEFSVEAVDPRASVRYVWKLTDPNGNTYQSDQISYSGGVSDMEGGDSRGTTVKISMNSTAEEGEYTISVQPVEKKTAYNGDVYEVAVGDPYSQVFHFWKTPNPKLKLLCEGCDGMEEDDKKLCPTDNKQRIVAVADIDPKTPSISRYIYTWTNTQSSGETTKDTAYVNLPSSQSCAGLLNEYSIGVHVEIEDIGCPANTSQTYKVLPVTPPTIDCSKLGTTLTYELRATETQRSIQLPVLPSNAYTKGCESDPTIKVELNFTPLSGGDAIVKTITTTEKKMEADLAANEVMLPAGSGTVTYSVIDGCNNTASCDIPIEMKDVTAPDIDCSKIQGYTAHLKYQQKDGEEVKCEATPGYSSTNDLPILTAPVLTDKNGVDGDITGVYSGRYSTTDESAPAYATPAQRALFRANVGLNDDFPVGNTYILWKFTDASDNSSYCLQKITVVDDVPPSVECPAFDDNISVDNQEGECGLSVNGLLAWLATNGYVTPEATDVCTGDGENIIPEIYYKEGTGAEQGISSDRYNEIIFHVGVKYTIIWRFKKKNTLNSVDCEISFTVKDTEAPVFNCSLLQQVYVTADTYKPKNGQTQYLEYATKDNVTLTEDSIGYNQWNMPVTYNVRHTYEGTMGDAFADGKIRMLTAGDVTDNCSGDVTVTASLTGPNEKKVERTVVINSTSDLENLKYGIGLTVITFTFKDKSGNESSCTQNIIVTAGTTPVPECPTPFHDTVYVNNECLASLKIEKDDVPTAQIPVNRTGVYFNFRQPVIAGMHFDEGKCDTVKKYFPNLIYHLHNANGDKYLNENATVQVQTGFFQTIVLPKLNPEGICAMANDYLNNNLQYNDWYFYQAYQTTPGNWFSPPTPIAGITVQNSNGIISSSDGLTKPRNYTGYPYKVTLEDAEGTVLETVLNPYTDEDKVPTRIVVPRWYSTTYNTTSVKYCDDAEDRLALVCETQDVKIVNNFESTILEVSNLTKGTYYVRYHFQDRKNGENEAECVHEITVLDTIKPKVECGDWSNEGTFPANENCQLPTSEVSWFKVPTAEQLKANDNCTKDYDGFTISWKRVFDTAEDVSSAALTNPFPMGTTTMYWYVADQSGNKTFCKQEITVEDKTAPVFDCSSLKNIEAYTGGDCVATADEVKKQGLVVPVAAQDKCSPTDSGEAGIEGVPTRSDGKTMEDVYPLGTTVITWKFTDAAGNSESCAQKVIVKDTTAPDFDCKDIKNLNYDLPAEACTASKDEIEAVLGSHTAHDECDGDIEGVPYVNEGGELVPLYDKFEPRKTYNIVWQFKDSEGNIKECSMELTVTDTTPPDPSGKCPDPTKSVDAETTCTVDYSELGLPTEESLAITDPCDGQIIPELVARITEFGGEVKTYRGEEARSASYPVGTHTIYWIYTDKSDNKDTCRMELTINDKTKPVLEDCSMELSSFSFTVSDTVCAIDPADVKAMFIEPKAYDECDDALEGTGRHYIEAVVQRYFVDSICTDNNDPSTCVKTETLVADGVTKMWDEDVFPKGVTKIKWVFRDKSGNEEFCEKTVTVVDHTPPFFDCDSINPDTLRPEAYPGKCEVEFAELKKDVLDGLAYSAYDACADEYIPGVLTLNGIAELPAEYTMKVGVLYKLTWLFQDEDGNKTTCPQWILPSHVNPLKFDCSTLEDTIKVLAKPGECVADVNTTFDKIGTPFAIDTCSEEHVYGVPTFFTENDTVGIDLQTHVFSTGDTTIHWMFVSPWNLHDTVWCEQVVSILGNKKFDIDCETVAPAVFDTIDGCEPSTSVIAKIDTPWVADPCADANSADYKRYGVGTRSDAKTLSDPYPLGITTIQWIFTDFTGNVKDTCVQEINVRTAKDIDFDCDKLNHDTIKSSYNVPEGVCTVAADLILPDPESLVAPKAEHPCLKDQGVGIPVFPRRKGGKSWTDDYIVGVNIIEWVFVDTTHTVVNDTVVCEQPLQVGDNENKLFDCDVIKGIRKELAGDDCTIDATSLDFKAGVPKAYDACGEYKGQEVVPTWSRTSGKSMEELFSVGLDTIIWKFHYLSIDDSVLCEQPIRILDSKEPNFDCDLLADTAMPSLAGECYLEKVSIKAMLDSLKDTHHATDACDESIIIQGVYDDNAVPSVLNVGDTITVHWVFQDTMINLSKKECDQKITVIGDMAPKFDCDSLPLDTFRVYDCDTTLTANEIKTPIAKDACTDADVPGIGVRLDGGDLYGKYPVGTTQIKWTFTSPFSTKDTFCIQDIVVLTKKLPEFDCSKLDTIRVSSEAGECFANADVVLSQLGDHYATETCTNTQIKGVYSAEDGAALPERFNVGDTTLIKWTFIDSSLNDVAKVCFQPVIVTGDQKPIFDCSSLSAISVEIEGCDTTLSDQTIETPIAKDACTGDDVPGVGRRLDKDNGDLYGRYQVGTTTIRWMFVSPFSSEVDSCDQTLTVKTKKEIDFDCETLKDTARFSVKEGECSTTVTLNGQTAKHPCPEESGVSKIIGVPSINGVNFEANEDSTVWTQTIATGIWDIKWTFTDHSNTMVNPEKTCTQPVKVGDTNQMPVDCDNYRDTIIKLSPEDCDITWEEVKFNAPPVVDLCSGDTITPALSRWSGSAISDPFTVGIDTVYWRYKYAGQDIVCSQMIDVLDSMAPEFDCSTLDSLQLVAKDGECEVSSDEIEEILGSHNAVDVCTRIEVPGRAFLNGVSVSQVSAKVGDTLNIKWIFIDSTLNAVAKECDQILTVVGSNAPIFDCKSLKDTTIYLRNVEECEFPGSDLKLNVPIAKDSCTKTDVPGVASRQDGNAMTDNFEKGLTAIDWIFTSPYSITPKVCPQNVVVVDTFAPVLACETLKDTIYAALSGDSEGNELSYEELENQDFSTPSVTDKCDGEITAVGRRSDGNSIEDNYPIGMTTVTWVYTDMSGNADSCIQVVFVEDLIDTLYCPQNFDGKTIACLDTFPAYRTLDELIAAGGSISNHSTIDASTFTMTEKSEGKEFCNEIFSRTYSVRDAKNRPIECTETVTVKDTVAPTFNTDIEGDTVMTCSNEIPELAKITATDNCDPEPRVQTSETSTRGTDATKCDYYNYEIRRSFTAIDRCENKREIVQTISVVDTIGPKFSRPENWKDTVLANNLKACTFGVPNLVVGMDEYVKDDCTDNTGIVITQNPEEGSRIDQTTTVWIIMTDLCNNKDSIGKTVRVQDEKEIVSLEAFSLDTCVSDANPFLLANQKARYATGYVEIVRKNTGTISKISSQFSYDYYKGTVDEMSDDNIIFSDNPLTHPDLVKYYRSNGGIDNLRNTLTALNRKRQSGYYTYVAMDTTTGCSDTAQAYLTINEAPRINIQSLTESMCELNLADTVNFNSYVSCVDPMGRDITEEGWMKDGEKFDLTKDTVYLDYDKSYLYYFATNNCGTTTSLNSLALVCDEDSANFVGNDAEKEKLLISDKLVVADSIVLDVHKRYDPSEITITTEPHDPARIWLGETVELTVHTDYKNYQSLTWYRVVGKYDRENILNKGLTEHDDFVYEQDSLMEDEEDYILAIDGYGQQKVYIDMPEDTARYYVTLYDGVCPSVASDLVQVNVILKLPTAFTPYVRDGLNDIFMERHQITIFDRYGQKVFEGPNGWDGRKGNVMADPGVYFYLVVMTDGSVRKGTIEVVFLNN